MNFKKCFLLIFINLITIISFAQTNSAGGNDPGSHLLSKNEQEYDLRNGQVFIYHKLKPFSFLTRSPKDAAGMASMAVKKTSIKPLLVIAGATTALLLADPLTLHNVQHFCGKINVEPEEENKNIVSIKLGKKETTLIKAPQNLNTAIYQFGQGMPSLLIASGLFIYGKRNHDYRALSTANQLAEAFILTGVSTQLLKRIAGRETPGEATAPRGKWQLFPSFKKFQNNTPRYDAFPSGHLTTLMSTVTILAENYPEKRWIKPVGYSLTGLVALSMLNNGVHWASDYPLAIGLGYLCARQLVKNSRRELKPSTKRKHGELSYTFGYTHKVLTPGIIYKF